jgi:hypothetical protein
MPTQSDHDLVEQSDPSLKHALPDDHLSANSDGCQQQPALALSKSAGNRAVTSLLRHPTPDSNHNAGQTLSPTERSPYERLLNRDFSNVQIHTDHTLSPDVEAVTVHNNIAFQRERYKPGTMSGRFLLAHELAHVAQQGKPTSDSNVAADTPAIEHNPVAEAEANMAGVHAAFGLGPMPVTASVAPGVASASTLSDEIDVIWNDKNKARVFDALRKHAPVSDPDIDEVLKRIFAAGSDDLWLAQTIAQYGPEPLWPTAAFDERRKRQRDNKWPAEPGGIEALLDVSTGGLPITAYFFPGTSDERALIIAGVHGSEQGGIEVAEMLIESLKKAPTRPFYSVIVVPTLFPDNSAKRLREGSTETNRNFPKPGTSLTGATAASKSGKPEDATGKPILRENVALLQLIDRFRPSRIASIHGSTDRASAGIFSDQHTVSRSAKDKAVAAHIGDPIGAGVALAGLEATATNKTQADHDLAIGMAKEMDKQGAGKAVQGNKLSGTPTSGWSGGVPGGTSLGGWGPQDITEGRSTDRPSMTVITVEVATNSRSTDFKKPADQAVRKVELEAYRDVVQSIFLGPPKKTP